MRGFIFLYMVILSCFLSSFCWGQEVRISIQKNQITLEDAFSHIEQQTQYTIAYANSQLDVRRVLNLSLKNESLSQALNSMLEGTGYTFRIRNYHIVIIPESISQRNHSQTKKSFIISGCIFDKQTGNALPYATITLQDSTSTPIIIGISNDKGEFHINTTQWPKELKISFIGYQTIIKETNKETSVINIGNLYLQEALYPLAETTVTGSNIEYGINKTTYLITEEMRKKATDVLGLLNQIHGIRYDKLLNTIKMGIESDILLLVDGTQHPEEYIKNLSPNQVSHIEILTEPEGRYISEGYSVIINILLKKDYIGYDVYAKNSTMVSFAGNNGKDRFANLQPGMGITYTNRKVNIFANYTYTNSQWNTPVWKWQDIKKLLITESEPINRSFSNNRFNYLTNQIEGGINYKINPTHILSVQFDYLYEKNDTKDEFNYTTTHLANNLIEKTNSLTTNKFNADNYVSTVFYKGKIGDRIELYSDFTYNHYKNNVQSMYAQNKLETRKRQYYESKDYAAFNVESSIEVSPSFQFNAGYSNSTRKYDSRLFDNVNLWKHDEYKNKGFLYLTYMPHRAFKMTVGTGFEYIKNTYNNQTRKKENFLPHIQIHYRTHKNVSMNLAYSTHNEYPSLYQLSPATTITDSLMTQTGNPDLRSTIIHRISAILSFKSRLTIKSIYEYAPYDISEVINPPFFKTFKNLKTYRYTTFVIYEQPIGKHFNLSHTFGYLYNKATLDDVQNSCHNWILNSEITYYHPEMQLEARLNYSRNMMKNVLLQGYQMNDLDSWNIFVGKQFGKEKLYVSLHYYLPIDWGIRTNQKKKIKTPYYHESYQISTQPYRNLVLLTFNLRFNSGKVNRSNRNSSVYKEKRGVRTVPFP